ncbi:MAG: site-specific DNA-methyltransferase [Candidatus Aenigmatarchaeota archaeon]
MVNEKIKDSETLFFEKLKEVFIGAKVEGESGYINLMKIKSKYFDKIFEILKKEIQEKTAEFPEFKEELFTKLYNFFSRYFSESGSVYYRFTPFNERIYERVYTDDKDVVMFWKTHMLYYVKTERLFKSMFIEINGFKFYFDVSKLQHKKAWEKKELVYELKEVKEDKTIVFNVLYSERGKKTNIDEILKELKKKGINLDENILEEAFKIFEKQSEVDYFINKNARQFLKEQFDLWLYQYVFSDETQFTEKRIKQLKVLKEIAYKIIDFIAQFEDELVKIWNKPKFVLNSNYVITLDRIAKKGEKGIKLIEKIIDKLVEQKKDFEKELDKWKKIKENKKYYRERFEEAGEIKNQIVDWYLLDLINEDFDPRKILIPKITGKGINPKYQFLPIDTKYFKDLEFEILDLFDNLDYELDGWLIKSENYQALNTILPKFKEKVQTIYIDPPFNKEQDADYFYTVKFKDSTWITMLENRLRLAREFLKDTGSIFVRCDYNGNMYVRLLMNEIFGEENFRNEIIVRRTTMMKRETKRFEVESDSLFLYDRNREKNIFNMIWVEREPFWAEMPVKYNKGGPTGKPIVIEGKIFNPPEGYSWAIGNEVANIMYKEGRLKIENDKIYVLFDKKAVGTNWTDIPGYSTNWGFKTENSEILLKRVIESTSNEGDLVMDFFLGSGTTTAVSHKLKRKWIGIEMGEHFYTVVLPRMKKVLAYDKTGISKEKDVKEKYNENNAGGFFKYYELEQYEDTLRRVKYADADPFFDPTQDPYNQYIFMKDLKLLEALEIDYNNNKVKVNLEKLYKNIDIAETLSNLLGKWIKKITEDYVEFEDGEKVNIKDLDYRLVKPLIWWE